jgi:Na+/proline symporter
VIGFALNSDANIFKMVENAYKVTLVTAFVPLAFGMAWKKANTQGAMLAILLGAVTWLLSEVLNPEGLMPPQLAGFFASVVGMVVGSLLPPLAPRRSAAGERAGEGLGHAGRGTGHAAGHGHSAGPAQSR